MPRKVAHVRDAFTLVELLVSLFLLMMVMVGVNTVFSSTSATIGANSAISATNRDARAIQATLGKDIASMASDSACLVIRSEQKFQFRNLADYNADIANTGNGIKEPWTADFTGSGTESPVSPVAYGSRSFRLDRMHFFTRQLLQRQTGNENAFVANQTTGEQWIWLGHLRMPGNQAFGGLTLPDFLTPGEGSYNGTPAPANPNNFFASQWTLGRMAMGLVQPTGGAIYDSAGVSQDFISRTSGLAPLSTGSTSTTLGGTAYDIQESRYDLAGTSILGYRTILSDWITANPTATTPWWTIMLGGPTSRFCGMPYANRPLNSRSISRLAPVLAAGSTQFIVEYAGDFLKQDTAGIVTDTYVRWDTSANSGAGGYVNGSTDGEMDWIVPAAGAKVNQRQIRWYGFPRGTAGNATVSRDGGDVVPLRDSWRASTWAGTNQSQATVNPPFERTGGSPTTNVLDSGPRADYNALTGTGGYHYIAAWAPGDTARPKLIRIVITLEDAQGRLPDGQTYEYVFAVP